MESTAGDLASHCHEAFKRFVNDEPSNVGSALLAAASACALAELDGSVEEAAITAYRTENGRLYIDITAVKISQPGQMQIDVTTDDRQP